MLTYGKNVAREVLKSDAIIKKVYVTESIEADILNLINKKKLNTITKDKNALDKMVDANTQGIVIDIYNNFFIDIDMVIDDKKSDFIVILDHIEDPHNFGAIIRTCECAGVDYILIPNKGNVEVNNTVMKTSAGALINTKICIVPNLRNAIEELKKNEYWVVGTDANGEDYTKINYKGRVALVIGSEGKGLKEIVRSSCDFIASIPLKGKINSLNASVASGIMIYEVLKTRE